MALKLFTAKKGSLTVEFAERAYNPGDEIDLLVKINSGKDLGPGRLYATLICMATQRRRSLNTSGASSSTERTEIFRHEVDLAVDASFPAGTDKSLTAKMPVSKLEDQEVNLPEGTPAWVGGLASLAKSGTKNMKLNWHVEVRYDIKGLDLTAKKKVSINAN